MTSKNSFLASLKEDNRRRLWLWLTSAFMFVIFTAVIFMIMLVSIDETSMIAQYGSRAKDIIAMTARTYSEVFLGNSVYRVCLSVLFACVAAFSGFIWMDDKVKVDFYESMPQKKSRHFVVSWLNGIIIYAVTYLIGVLLCYAILASFGFGSCYSLADALVGFAYCLIFFIGVYHLTILAIALTGNPFAAVCAFFVLSMYEFLIRCIWEGFSNLFILYHCYGGEKLIPEISPFGTLIQGYIQKDYFGYIPAQNTVKLLFIAVLFGVLAYIAYIKRPMEAAAKTLAYRWTEIPLKMLIAIPATAATGLCAMLITNGYSNRLMAVVVIVLVISAVIICAIIEAVFELDVKALFKKKLHWIVCAVVVICVFFMFREDVFNLKRLPSKNSVESVAFIPSELDGTYQFFTKELRWVSSTDYCARNMFITDIDDVYELAELSTKDYEEKTGSDVKTGFNDYYNYYRNRGYDEAVVVFRLKNGRKVYKNIFVPKENTKAWELEDRILSSKEFVDGYFSLKNLEINEDLVCYDGYNSCSFSNNIINISFSTERGLELLKCYQEDLDDYDHSVINTQDSIGQVYLGLMMEGGLTTYGTTVTFNVYPNMKRTVALLKEMGYSKPEIKREDIEELTLNYYRYSEDEYNELYYTNPDEYFALTESEDMDKEVVYSGEKLDELFPYLVMLENGSSWNWGKTDRYEEAYTCSASVLMDGKNNSDVLPEDVNISYNMYSGKRTELYFAFPKGQVPDFVKKDLGIE